jgi:peptide/nickel transport system permease protein
MTTVIAPDLVKGQDKPAPTRTALFGITIIALISASALFAPLLAPHDPNFVDLSASLAEPSLAHPLGFDGAGRDILSRLLFGARLSLLGPLVVVVAAALIGVPLGIAAGFAGGFIDTVLSRSFDVLFAFPALLLAAVIVATFGPGFTTIVTAVTVIYVPLMARVVRAATLMEINKPYVDAMRVQGFGAVRICVRHIAPNVGTLIIGQTALYFGYALLDLAGLSFLGFGVQPPTPDWGSMLWYSKQQVYVSPLGVIPPAAAIVLSVVAFNLVGDWLSDRASAARFR